MPPRDLLSKRLNWTEFARDRRGFAAIVFALAAAPAMLAVGVGVDYSRVLAAKAQLQQSLDEAVLAGVQVGAAQRATVAANSLNASLSGTSLTGVSPRWTTNADGSFTGTATASARLLVAQIAGLGSATVSSSATALTSTTTTGTTSTTKACILVLDPTASQALVVNSNVTINAPACEIDVVSTGSPAAVFNANDTFNVSRICVGGTNTLQNGGAVAKLETGCATASNPFASSLPTVTAGSCTVSNMNYTGTSTLSPGTYCGTFNFNSTGTLNLQPGLYVFKGTRWNLNTGWTISGTGVTFYFADSNSYIQINGGAVANLSAPTTGTYANILMFEPNGLTQSPITVNGSTGHNLNGLMYLPSRNVIFNYQANMTTENLTLVVNQLIIDSLTWNLATAPLSITPANATTATTTTRVRLTQ